MDLIAAVSQIRRDSPPPSLHRVYRWTEEGGGGIGGAGGNAEVEFGLVFSSNAFSTCNSCPLHHRSRRIGRGGAATLAVGRSIGLGGLF